MKLPLAVLGMTPREVEHAHEAKVYQDWCHSLPMRPQRGMVHAAEVLEKLFNANLLAVNLPEGPLEEDETILVRGIGVRVKRIQDRRLVLELIDPARRFRRKWDWRATSQPEEVAK
jgi:hypothetical protein